MSHEICEIGRALAAAGHLVAGDGNISRRVGDLLEITRSGIHKGRLTPADIVRVDFQGQPQDSNLKPSSELIMHLEVYKRCPDARYVAHAHPKAGIAWSMTGLPHLPPWELPEVILAAGSIPIAPYARPGTPAMATVIQPYLPECRIILLARHGALVWGESPDEVIFGMDRLEQVCSILFMTSVLARNGFPIESLDPQEIEALVDLRRKLGPRLL